MRFAVTRSSISIGSAGPAEADRCCAGIRAASIAKTELARKSRRVVCVIVFSGELYHVTELLVPLRIVLNSRGRPVESAKSRTGLKRRRRIMRWLIVAIVALASAVVLLD